MARSAMPIEGCPAPLPDMTCPKWTEEERTSILKRWATWIEEGADNPDEVREGIAKMKEILNAPPWKKKTTAKKPTKKSPKKPTKKTPKKTTKKAQGKR